MTKLPNNSGSDAPYRLAPGVPYEYPQAEGTIGAAVEVTESTPAVFRPLKIANMTVPNRIGVSPMCQYSADNSEVTEYHKVHYGGYALRGPGLIVVEATSVAPNAGTAVVDLGIWKDSQAEKFRPIIQYAHANTSHIGIQIGHAGRKALLAALFESLEDWDPRGNKDDVVGPSAVPYRPYGRLPVPRAMTVAEIRRVVTQFGDAARRAVSVGFDFVEIHGAHGYLISEFMSNHSNKRTDEYGGSFENRTRLLLEVIDSVRANVPADYPVFLRWSASEMHDANPNAWTIEDSVRLAPLVVEHGVNFLDVSAGGNDSNAEHGARGFGMFVDYARRVKEAVGDTAIVSAVGRLHDPVKVNELIEQGVVDFAMVGLAFLVNQGLVFDWAQKLDVALHHAPQFWPLRPKYAELLEYIKALAEAEAEALGRAQ